MKPINPINKGYFLWLRPRNFMHQKVVYKDEMKLIVDFSIGYGLRPSNAIIAMKI